SPDAYRTISEVASDLELPQHVLRFWETRFPHIKPLKRGGGRRYYRPDDVDLVRGIRHLLYGAGYTIKGVQRILKDQGAKYVQAIGQTGAVDLLAEDIESPSGGVASKSVSGSIAVRAQSPTLEPVGRFERPFQQSIFEALEDDAHDGGDAAPGMTTPQMSHSVPSREMPAMSLIVRLEGVLTELEECARLLALARSGMAD
ncbi:MAG: MerR family transcriptional regulator, partial [Hyphomicrobiales bacterium]